MITGLEWTIDTLPSNILWQIIEQEKKTLSVESVNSYEALCLMYGKALAMEAILGFNKKTREMKK